MSDLEPIELEFLINSPELLAELQAASAGMKSHDEAVQKVTDSYDKLQKSEKEAGKTTAEVNKGMQGASDTISQVSQIVDGFSGSVSNAAGSLDKLDSAAESLSATVRQQEQALAAIIARYDGVNAKQGEAEKKTGSMKEGVSKLGTALLQTGGNLDQVTEVFGDFVQETIVSSANVGTLTKIKEFWAAVNLRVATTLGISTAAAQALTATVTLGLSVAIGALIYLFQNFKTEAQEAADMQKKFGETVAETAADSITSFLALQAQWNALGDDLRAKQKFVEDNQKNFNSLGIAVDGVTDAENVLVAHAGAMVEALLEKARAMAAMKLAADELQESLRISAGVQAREDRYKDSWSGGIDRFMNEKVGGFLGWTKTAEDAKKHDEKAKSFLNQKVKSDSAYNNILINNGIKLHEDLRKSEKTQLEKDAEVYKARTGKKAFDLLIKNEDNKLKQYQKDSEAWKAAYQQRSVLTAEKLHEQDEAAKRASDKAASEAEKNRRKQEAEQKKAETAARNFAEKQKSFLARLAKEENAEKNKGNAESDEAAKINSHADEIKEQARKVGMLNKDVEARIEKLRSTQLAAANYREDTEKLVKELAVRKELYAAFEAYRENLGSEEAKNVVGEKISEFKNFGEELDAEIKKITSSDTLSASESERLKKLQDMRTAYDADAEKQDKAKYADALKTVQNLQEKQQIIEEEYQSRRLQLAKVTNEKERTEKIAALDKQRDASIDAANAEAYEKAMVFERLSQNLIGITKAELANRVATLEEYLHTAQGLTEEQKTFIEKELEKAKAISAGSDAEVRQNALLQKKKELQQRIRDLQAKGIQNVQQEAQELEAVNMQLRDIPVERMKEFADRAGALSSIFGQLAGDIGDTNSALADTLNSMSQILSASQDFANAWKDIKKNMDANNGKFKLDASSMIGIASSLISGIGKLFKMGKEARESAKKAREEIAKYYDELTVKENAYRQLLRERERQIVRNNKLTLDGIKDSFALLGQQQGQIQSQYERLLATILSTGQQVTGEHTEKYGGFLGFGRKTKVVQSMAGVSGMDFSQLEALYEQGKLTESTAKLFEQLRKLKDEGADVAKTLEDLAKEAQQLWTGTTADSITDSIVEGFKNGYRTAEDFADNFEEMMRGAMLSSFKYQIVQKQIEEFYKKFANAADNGGLSQEKIDQLRTDYAAMIQGMGAQFDQLAQVTGLGFDTASGNINSLQGAYKASSQESIDLLAGQTSGMRLAQLETNQILKAGAAAQLENASKMVALNIAIEANTRRTADNTEVLPLLHDTLKRVETALKEGKNTLTSIGIK